MRSEVSVTAHVRPPLTGDMLTVTIVDGPRTYVLRADELGGTGKKRVLGTREDGTLTVSFLFARADTTVSEGGADVPLIPSLGYAFQILVDSVNPVPGRCRACAPGKSFPIDPRFAINPRDSVWLIWKQYAIDPLL